jgi:eukaryotic-like serine/threonine-protein kinase
METIESLGKYEIKRTLGRGAMGIVYEGWDPIIARRVAIKTVKLPEHADDPETEEALARFRREAQAAGRLTHPNIVGVFDYGETDDLAYIVMEFVDGPPLKSLLDKEERFALTDAIRVMEDLLAGLQFSHERGVVHRDIKPANVMLTSAGQVKIADFGIARIESSSMTQAGTLLGTPAYMSPEQFMGQVVDARTDIYSSGVLLYQLLTGERPFEGGLSAIMHKALNTEPPAPSQLSVTAPPALDAVVRKAMAKRPEDRFASANVFAEAVRTALANPVSVVEPESEDEATMVASPPPVVPGTAPQVREARPATAISASAVVARPATRSSAPIMLIAAIVLLALVGGGGTWWFLLRSPAVEKTAQVTPPPVTPAAPPVITSATPPPASQSQTAVAPVQPTPTPPAANQPEQPPPAVAANPPQPPAPASSQPTGTPTEQSPSPASQPVQASPEATTQSPQQPPAAMPTPQATQPPPPATKPDTQVAIAGLTALRGRIADWASNQRCALLGGNLGDGGTVDMSGFAGNQTIDTLRQGVAAIVPPGQVDWRVHGVDQVFCPALNALHPFVPAFASTGGARLNLQLADGRSGLRDGEQVRLRLVMPDFASRLRVDYLVHDGTVGHLYPQIADPALQITADVPRTFTPDETVNLSHPSWTITPPYGTDMIIAIASSQPLFDRPRPSNGETADVYLRALQTALERAHQRGDAIAGAAITLDALPK